MIVPADFSGKWVQLHERAIFRVSGPDRVRYLNGQVSNDVAGPLHEKAIAACLCSLKGKVEFLVWISACGEDLILDGQLDQREALAARLDRYLIADDCEITDVTGELSLFHHFDPELGGVRSRRCGTVGFDCFSKPGEFPLDPGHEIPGGDFATAQALSLIPVFPHEITGGEFPAELGLDRWAVDFHKGCYLGQEVISRIKSVGRVKRSLILATAETPLEQDSIVRTDRGVEGRVTRVVETKNEKNHLALCLVKESPDSAESLVPQRIEPVNETPGLN